MGLYEQGGWFAEAAFSGNNDFHLLNAGQCCKSCGYYKWVFTLVPDNQKFKTKSEHNIQSYSSES